MTTFDVLWKCLPCFVLVGMGLYFLLTALVPSWREEGWKHWKIYSGSYNSPNSWLVSLGFAKASKPIKEGDEKTAIRLYCVFGSLLMLIGIGAIVWIAYLSPGD
ncbi:MAG TPA: hypothetical protein VF938_08955 [Candidatus Angelobacter sp.]